jgi:hypothetical protein
MSVIAAQAGAAKPRIGALPVRAGAAWGRRTLPSALRTVRIRSASEAASRRPCAPSSARSAIWARHRARPPARCLPGTLDGPGGRTSRMPPCRRASGCPQGPWSMANTLPDRAACLRPHTGPAEHPSIKNTAKTLPEDLGHIRPARGRMPPPALQTTRPPTLSMFLKYPRRRQTARQRRIRIGAPRAARPGAAGPSAVRVRAAPERRRDSSGSAGPEPP